MKTRRIVGERFEVAFIWADRLTFPAHSHDEYVLSCNISGNEKLVLDGRPMEAAESATTLYNPGQSQGGDGTSALVSVYLHPEFFERELLANRAIDFDKPIVDDAELLRHFTGMISMVMNNASPAEAEEAIFRAVDCAAGRYTVLKTGEPPAKDDWRVLRIKDILMARLADHVFLKDLAQEVGLDKLTMLHMFSAATGLPPISWQRMKRIEAARRLIRSGKQIADVAATTGFSDQAHLTRLFGRAYGITPGRFARA